MKHENVDNERTRTQPSALHFQANNSWWYRLCLPFHLLSYVTLSANLN